MCVCVCVYVCESFFPCFSLYPWLGSSPPETTFVRIGERKSGDMQTSCRETVEHNSDTRTPTNDAHIPVPLRTL